MDRLLGHLTCPLSKRLFLHPVITNDGTVYEKDEVNKNILKKDGTLNFDITYTDSIQVKYLVDTLIESFPDLKNRRYDPRGREKVTVEYNKDTIINIIKHKKYRYLLYFDKFVFKDLDYDMVHSIVLTKYHNIVEHVIKHCEDLDTKLEEKNSCICGYCPTGESFDVNILNILTKCGMNDMVKLVVNDNIKVDINQLDSNGYSPVRNLLENIYIRKSNREKTVETIKYMIDHGVNLFIESGSRDPPILTIIKDKLIELVDYTLDNVDMTDEQMGDLCAYLQQHNESDIYKSHMEKLSRLMKKNEK